MRTTGFGLSHVGRVRQRNEDALFIDPQGRFALLADGMGGHRGGQEASRMAIDLVQVSLERAFEVGFPAEETGARVLLRTAFKEAARQVAERGRAVPELENMGTTLVSWTVSEGTVTVAHVGDSRAYLLRQGQLFQITMDHVLTNEQIRLGMEREQAERVPMGHVLVRNIGVVPPSEPDIVRFDARAGDRWLLCSDGLSNKLLHADILHLLNRYEHRPAEATKALVEEAWHRGGEDNITAVLLDML